MLVLKDHRHPFASVDPAVADEVIARLEQTEAASAAARRQAGACRTRWGCRPDRRAS